MAHLRTVGLAALVALGVATGCKNRSETFQTPGANVNEVLQEGRNAAHDHHGEGDHTFGMPGATPEEVTKGEGAAGHDDGKSGTLSTPGETVPEAQNKGLLPGIGGGPKDEGARPSTKTAPPFTDKSTEKKDTDHTFETPGATEKEVTDEDTKTSPLGKGQGGQH